MEETKIPTNKRKLNIPSEIGLDVSGIIIEIYDNNNLKLRNFLTHHLDSKSDIDDVMQEVYFRLIKYWKPDAQKPTLQMLCTIALNIIRNRFNRQKSLGAHPHVPIDEVDIASQAPSPEEILIYQKRVDIIRGVFKQLNKNSRRAFSLHRFKGYTYDEIAEKMGISKSMVQKHISHTLSQLRKKMMSLT